MSRCCFTLFAALSFYAFLIPLSATAAVIEAAATPFTGADLTVLATVDDGADPGNLVITLEVVGGDIGDLRGFFAHIEDEALLAGMSVSGVNVSDGSFGANSIINLGGGSNLQGGGSSCPCDLGVEFGSPGIGKDDLQSVTFTLSHATENLDVSLFETQAFGVRATSVGAIGFSREGSSKMGGTLPVVPEPSTAVLMFLGLAGLTGAGTRARA